MNDNPRQGPPNPIVLQLNFTIDVPLDQQTLLRMMGVPLPAVPAPASTHPQSSIPSNFISSSEQPLANASDTVVQTGPQPDVSSESANANGGQPVPSTGPQNPQASQPMPTGTVPNVSPQASGSQAPPQPQQQHRHFHGPQVPGFIVTLGNGQQIFVPEQVLRQQLGAMGIGAPAFHPGAALSQDQYEQLLNQLFNAHRSSGPPPTAESFLKSIPTARIDQTHIDKKEECSICKDEFILDQQVASLPCGHLYHEECVVPWLKEHNTCPYCRYQLPAVSEEEQRRKREEEEARQREHIMRERQRREAAERERRRQQQEAYNRQRQRMLAAQVLHTTRQNQLERERERERQQRILESVVLATRMNQQKREERRAQQSSSSSTSSSSQYGSSSSSSAFSPTSSTTVPPQAYNSSFFSPTLSNQSSASPQSTLSPSQASQSSHRCGLGRLFGECVLDEEIPAFVTLSCGHEFHEPCLEGHLRVTGEHRAARFRCPTCMRDSSRLEQMDVD